MRIEKQLHKEADDQDKELDDETKAAALTKGDKFKRILAYSKPKYGIIVGMISSVI